MSPRRFLAEHDSRDIAEWFAFFQIERERLEEEHPHLKKHKPRTTPVPNLHEKLRMALGVDSKKKS